MTEAGAPQGAASNTAEQLLNRQRRSGLIAVATWLGCPVILLFALGNRH
ncbi:hypothetical protein [Streptomyces kaniharaensis]|nr:hypothetical protein [Streptomyces kaniharaensis]